MHEEHQFFEAPGDPDMPLWRYMDLSKFLALLEDESLFFARADTMADRFEGAMGPVNAALRPQLYGDHYPVFYPQIARLTESMRRFTYLSCWHASEHESAAMWGLYQRDGRGIAVRSTFERLTKSLRDDRSVFVGMVHYVNYDQQFIPEGNSLAPYVYKRASFEHEQELRAVTQDLGRATSTSPEGGSTLDLDAIGPAGLKIPVDIAQLIESVYIAPEAEDWFAVLVERLVRRYGHEWPVRHSDLAQDPIY
jgi:hypothetical protein